MVLDHYLTALEPCDGVRRAIRIMAVSTETPQAMFAFDSYRDVSPRLAGLTWGAEDLSTAVGASTNRVDSGEYEFTYQLARSLCLLGANAAGVQAIDTMTPDFRDRERLQREVRASRRAGFTGKIAIHPDQVDRHQRRVHARRRRIAPCARGRRRFRAGRRRGRRAARGQDARQAASHAGIARDLDGEG